MKPHGRFGLAAVALLAVLTAASMAALGEDRRNSSPFSEKNKSSSDGSEVKELFEGLKSGLGFGDDEDAEDDGEEHQGTYIERFETPGLTVYEELAADRAAIRAMQRSEGFGLVAAPELNAYVNRVLQRVVAASPVPDLDTHAFVRAEPRFSAHSTPDGSIYVTIRLLQDIGSEDELAAVLAHELAHVLYRHHGTDWFANSQKIAAQVLSLKDYAQGIVEGAQKTGDSQTVLMVSFASEMSERVIAPNLWNREQEREADGLGLDLMMAAGYLSSAAFTSLERLAFYEAEARELSRRQLEAVADAAEADMNEAIESGDLSQIIVGLVEGAGKVLDTASDSAIDTIGGGNHDPAEVRIERLDEYLYRAYEDDPRPDSTDLPWQSPADPTAPVLANYLNASKAGIALDEGKLREAESLSRTAVSGPTKADAFPRYILSQVRAQQGDLAKAYQNLEIASDGPEPAFAIYDLMIRKQLAGGRRDEAVRLVDKASRRLDEPPNLFPYRIAVLVDAKKKAEALALFTRCKLSYPDLAPSCNRALGGLQGVAAGDGGTDSSATNELIDREVGGAAKKVTTGFGN